MTDQNIFGHFDAPDQTLPAYDPGLDVPCPICLERVGKHGICTISLRGDDEKSYFFRAHKQCWDGASLEEQGQIEGALIDDIASRSQSAGVPDDV